MEMSPWIQTNKQLESENRASQQIDKGLLDCWLSQLSFTPTHCLSQKSETLRVNFWPGDCGAIGSFYYNREVSKKIVPLPPLSRRSTPSSRRSPPSNGHGHGHVGHGHGYAGHGHVGHCTSSYSTWIKICMWNWEEARSLVGNTHNGCSEPGVMEPQSSATYQTPCTPHLTMQMKDKKCQKLVHNRCARCNLCNFFNIWSFHNTFTYFYK